ncbi:MAG: hypothetical protein JWM22_1826 [Frankiales bacterium]|nr:hypothetical protein [Frankiales bacterium]
MTSQGALDVLARIRARRPEPSPYARCEMCAAPVADSHQHVVNIRSRSLLCTCRPCYLLFTSPDAHLAYRSVPDRYLAFPDLAVPVWDELQLPVGTAFLFLNSALERVVAFYPGPAGATESELGLAAWDRVVEACPALTTLRADVEALLVRAEEQRVEAFLVPIDVCYELVGTLRQLWRGFDGGQAVRERLAAFFDDVRAKAKPP